MRKELVNDLICPDCEEAIDLIDHEPNGSAEIECGCLMCPKCDRAYDIRRGVPYFARDLGEQQSTADGFGFEWSGFWNGLFDTKDVFGLSVDATADYVLASTGLTASDLYGKRFLDAGTGSGRIPMAIQSMGCEVLGVDIHRGLDDVAARMSELPGVQFVQADLLKLPLRPRTFDVVWSSGVIMATPDAEGAFRSLAAKVKPGGRLFVSVYSNDLHHYRLIRRLLPFARYLPPTANYILSALLALPLFVAFNAVLFLVRLLKGNRQPPYTILGFTIENTDPKSYSSIVLNIYDQLHPRFQTEHSIEEVEGWFVSNGFEEIVATEAGGGMSAARGVRIAP